MAGSRFVSVHTVGLETIALFNTQDIAEANMLRRAIMSEIPTWGIHLVQFDVNTSPRHDELLAQRLGLIGIKQRDFDQLAGKRDRVSFNIDYTAPANTITNLTTQMALPEVPFVYDTPIVSLLPGDRLKCTVFMERGKAATHPKWCPVSVCGMEPHPENLGYYIRFKSVGMMEPMEILEQGLAQILSAAQRKPSTIFSRPLIPKSLEQAVFEATPDANTLGIAEIEEPPTIGITSEFEDIFSQGQPEDIFGASSQPSTSELNAFNL